MTISRGVIINLFFFAVLKIKMYKNSSMSFFHMARIEVESCQ